jgi:cystathionine beta-lyase
LVPVLQARRDHLLARFAAELPEARMLAPEATYLAWADFTALPLRQTAFRTFLDGGVALSPGEAFAPESGHFARLNFATSEHLLDTVIDRVVAAAKGLTRAAAE